MSDELPITDPEVLKWLRPIDDIPVEGINDPYWRIVAKGEWPEIGQDVWICAHGRIARALYGAENRWLNRHGRTYTMPDGTHVRAPYWLPFTHGDQLPHGPGHDADYAKLNHGQWVLTFTTAPTPIWASYDPNSAKWLDSQGQMVEGVRFWKLSWHPDEPAEVDVVDPQRSLEDI